MKHTIYIENWLPTSDNKLMGNRWEADRLKKIDTQMIFASAHLQKIPKATGKRIVAIILTIGKSKRGRRPDPTNFYKSPLDALVKCDYLIDDNSEYLEHIPTKVIAGDKTSTTIHLTDCEGA